MRTWLHALGVAIALVLAVATVAPEPAVADDDPAATSEPQPPHEHEILVDRPSGFWTSNRPAVGGAYRYRLLGIGVVVAAGMGVLMWRLVKKQAPAR